MKMTVKEFVKLDLTSLMQVNGGTSACGNYTQTQPATPPSGGNETDNAPSNNGGGTGESANTNDTPSSYSPGYSGGSTTGTTTGTCGGSGGQTPLEKPPKTNDKPNNDTTNNNNNNGGSTSVGGCSSINGGNGNGDGDELKGKESKEDDVVANDLPTEPTTPPEQPTSPNTPNEDSIQNNQLKNKDINWNESFNSDASLYGKGIDLNELPDGLKSNDRITKSESDRLYEDYCIYVNDGWKVIVEHAGYSYGMGNNQNFGDYTIYNLCSPNGEIITQAYDLNNDGVIDYAR